MLSANYTDEASLKHEEQRKQLALVLASQGSMVGESWQDSTSLRDRAMQMVLAYLLPADPRTRGAALGAWRRALMREGRGQRRLSDPLLSSARPATPDGGIMDSDVSMHLISQQMRKTLTRAIGEWMVNAMESKVASLTERTAMQLRRRFSQLSGIAGVC